MCARLQAEAEEQARKEAAEAQRVTDLEWADTCACYQLSLDICSSAPPLLACIQWPDSVSHGQYQMECWTGQRSAPATSSASTCAQVSLFCLKELEPDSRDAMRAAVPQPWASMLDTAMRHTSEAL